MNNNDVAILGKINSDFLKIRAIYYERKWLRNRKKQRTKTKNQNKNKSIIIIVKDT